jgi:hypothetical protein
LAYLIDNRLLISAMITAIDYRHRHVDYRQSGHPHGGNQCRPFGGNNLNAIYDLGHYRHYRHDYLSYMYIATSPYLAQPITSEVGLDPAGSMTYSLG